MNDNFTLATKFGRDVGSALFRIPGVFHTRRWTISKQSSVEAAAQAARFV